MRFFRRLRFWSIPLKVILNAVRRIFGRVFRLFGDIRGVRLRSVRKTVIRRLIFLCEIIIGSFLCKLRVPLISTVFVMRRLLHISIFLTENCVRFAHLQIGFYGIAVLMNAINILYDVFLLLRNSSVNFHISGIWRIGGDCHIVICRLPCMICFHLP